MDDTAANGISLKEPQARSLAVGVRRLSELLDAVAQLLDDQSPHAVGRVLVLDITDAERQDARRCLATARQDLQALVERLGVMPEQRSVRSAFSAFSASAWTAAEDLHPRRLRAYGPVDPQVQATLAPLIERLSATLMDLSATVPAQPGMADEHTGP